MTIINVKATRIAIAASAALLLSASAHAAMLDYNVNFMSLNGSSVTGAGTITLDTTTDMLTVQYTLHGLDTGMHPMHIHGRFAEGPAVPGGTPIPPAMPSPAFDTDHDGYIEDDNHEALPMAGDIILGLSLTPGMADFPTVGGTYHYSQVFNLADPTVFQPPSEDTGEVYSMADLLPLDFRSIEIHGGTVPAGVGAGTDGEVDGTGGYKEHLPVAMGLISAASSNIPEPATFLLFGAGALGLARYRRRRAQKAS